MRLRSATAEEARAEAMDIDPLSNPESEGVLERLQREAEKGSAGQLWGVDPMDGDGCEPLRLWSLDKSESARRLRSWRQKERGSDEEDRLYDNSIEPRPELTYEDMQKLFPSIPGAKAVDTLLLDASDRAPKKGKINRWGAHQLRGTGREQKPERKATNTISDMGLFDLLPGELRNYIYRLAFAPPPEQQPVHIVGSDLVCGNGECVHWYAPVAAPAIASTCRQIRNELLPIFCAENTFHFNTAMVRNRCVAAWIESMDTYARLIRRITLEIIFYDRTAPLYQPNSQVCELVINCPVAREDGKFEIVYDAKIPAEKIRCSALPALVEKLNTEGGGVRSQASGLAQLMASDELCDLVFYCKK